MLNFVNYSDYHVVGCGDRTVSMWDHRNGNLLIDIEIELPTIGRNIACYTAGGDEVSIIFSKTNGKKGFFRRVFLKKKKKTNVCFFDEPDECSFLNGIF